MRLVVLLLAGLFLQAPIASAAPATDVSAARVLELTNAERQKAGLGPLVLSSELADAAQAYTLVLAGGSCFDHTCGDVPEVANRLGQAGYSDWTSIGENIAAGYPTPEAVVAGWMASKGHRENILSPSYTEIGIGLVTGAGQYGTYWTQDFGTRRGGPRASDPPSAPGMDETPPDDTPPE